MDDLIDRQVLLLILKKNDEEYWNSKGGGYAVSQDIIDEIRFMPKVDTEPHAHWKEDGIDPYDDCAFYKCTNCNRLLIFSIDDLTPDEYGYRYCPFCGCKMEKNK